MVWAWAQIGGLLCAQMRLTRLAGAHPHVVKVRTDQAAVGALEHGGAECRDRAKHPDHAVAHRDLAAGGPAFVHPLELARVGVRNADGPAILHDAPAERVVMLARGVPL
jgi:hypothetical protein